jgi:hypothetical protein
MKGKTQLPPHPLDRRLDELQNCYGCCGMEEGVVLSQFINFLQMSEIVYYASLFMKCIFGDNTIGHKGYKT